MDAFGFAVFGREHLHLPSMGDLYHDFAIILGKRLLPGLPIHSHVSMINCASEELESNTVSLTMKRQKNFIAHELVFFELKVESPEAEWFYFDWALNCLILLLA